MEKSKPVVQNGAMRQPDEGSKSALSGVLRPADAPAFPGLGAGAVPGRLILEPKGSLPGFSTASPDTPMSGAAGGEAVGGNIPIFSASAGDSGRGMMPPGTGTAMGVENDGEDGEDGKKRQEGETRHPFPPASVSKEQAAEKEAASQPASEEPNTAAGEDQYADVNQRITTMLGTRKYNGLEVDLSWMKDPPIATTEQEAAAFSRIMDILERAPWTADFFLPHPTPSEIAGMDQEQRLQTGLAMLQNLEQLTQAVSVSPEMQRQMGGVPATIHWDSKDMKITGMEGIVTYRDVEAGTAAKIGQVSVALMPDGLLRIMEVQRKRATEIIPESLYFSKPLDEINAEIDQKAIQTQRKIGRTVQRGRHNTPSARWAGMEEALIVTAWDTLREAGAISEDTDIEIPSANETFWGATDTMSREFLHPAISKEASRLPAGVKTALEAVVGLPVTHRDFGERMVDRIDEAVANDILLEIQVGEGEQVQTVPVSSLLNDFLAAQIAPEHGEISSERMQELATGSASQRIQKFGPLSKGYLSGFYAYGNAFRDLDPTPTPVGRRIAASKIKAIADKMFGRS